ncbi:Choline-sulfatase [Stieleria bergensis]|uniref:Choline-sulfatase n=1 Tax=Stieleria bergensis TaxID=2528025 RepID=A0A517SZN9_9BACT|nr:Choline-sulfatase [Planctomycetes bacterium SV_7m_r]
MTYFGMRSATFILFLVGLMMVAQGHSAKAQQARPNVLFIIVDDLNDLPLQPDGKPLVPTPNFDRLAARGVTFTNAHCNDPICAPSRSSMLFGLYPQTSSLYWFENWRQNEVLRSSVSLTRHLRDGGYDVFGTGKIYHGNQDDQVYKRQGPRGNIGPWPWDGRPENKRGYIPHPDQLFLYDVDPYMDYKWEHTFGPLSQIPHYPKDEANGVPGYKGWTLSGKPWRYQSDDDRDLMPDEMVVRWSANVLAEKHERPFALFTGLVRTHTPLYAPQKYFDRFPIDEIKLPAALENDLADTAPTLGDQSLYGFRRYQMLHKHPEHPDLYKQWLQAYMACVAFIDDQVGEVLDALDRSPYRDNTVVFLTSDHGFHMGEKENLYKQTLWDGATKIPLIVAGLNGMPQGVKCDQPVSLIDVYPTFNQICQLPTEPNKSGNGYPLDGHSLVPLLKEPQGKWDGPSVAITALPGKDHSQHTKFGGTLYPHFSVRSKQFRYSLTSTGQEELYDFGSDPYESKNLASDPGYVAVKAELREQLIELRDGDRWQSLDQLSDWVWGAKKGGANELAGLLSFRGHQSFYLSTAQTLQDFELAFEFQSSARQPLLLSYHAKLDGNQVNGPSVSLHPTASNQAGRLVQLREQGWNHCRVRVFGDRCQVWLNHQVLYDLAAPEVKGSGKVGFSVPGAAQPELELRNIRLR